MQGAEEQLPLGLGRARLPQAVELAEITLCGFAANRILYRWNEVLCIPAERSNELKILRNKLDNLIDIIFKERASYYFYHGIVRDLKKEISNIIPPPPPNYLPEFKWNVHLYALLKFKPKMIKFQEEWDKENTPLGMLDQKKDEYLKIIELLVINQK